jgi:hypothetical protein
VRLDANLSRRSFSSLTPQSHGDKSDAASRDIGLGYSIRPLLLIPDPESAQSLAAEPAGDGSIGKINFN